MQRVFFSVVLLVEVRYDPFPMPRTLVIVPTFNERDNVEPLSRALLARAPDVHILFVDDASPDGTGEILNGLAARDQRIRVLHRAAKDGLGRAYVEGFLWALRDDYTHIFEMDADFSHRPADFVPLREALEDADVAVGSRYMGGSIRVVNWPLSRLALSLGAARYVRWITGLPFFDPTSGFKGYRREVIEALGPDRLRSNGYAFQIETLHTAWMEGFRIVEVPILFEERRVGRSKMNTGIVREALGSVWRLWWRAKGRRRPRPSRP